MGGKRWASSPSVRFQKGWVGRGQNFEAGAKGGASLLFSI